MYISIDVEADGPIPGDYSMVSFGAVVVLDHSKRFFGLCQPISERWIPEALAVSGYSREETLRFANPETTMKAFAGWLAKECQPPYVFVADNNGFDWGFINWYFWHFYGSNPFGWSSRNLNDVFHGLKGDMRASFKGLRKTKHDHNPVHDALSNATALVVMIEEYGLKGVR